MQPLTPHMGKRYLQFNTKLFQFTQTDESMGNWLVGIDCLAWFYSRIANHEYYTNRQSPAMEDWGWVSSFEYKDYCIALYVTPEYESKDENEWHLGINIFKAKMLMKTDETIVENLYHKFCTEIDSLTKDDYFSNCIWHEGAAHAPI